MVMRDWLKRCPLISILRGIETADVNDVFAALNDEGILIAEIPLNSPDPFASIQKASELFGDSMLIGAGTVTRVEDVRRVQQAGGRLIVSPHAHAEIVREAKQLDLLACPGVGTATEAFAMVEARADALKLFPADVFGTRMLTGLRAVLPKGMLILPVGGVDAATIPVWQKAGADGYGVGSSLYKPGMTGAQVAAAARLLMEALHAE